MTRTNIEAPLAELKLRAYVADLEVRLAEQRIEYDALIWKAREIILVSVPDKESGYGEDRREWLDQTDKLFP